MHAWRSSQSNSNFLKFVIVCFIHQLLKPCCKRIKRSTHLHQAQCSRDKRHLFPCIREKSASKSANMPLSLNARLQNSSRSSLVSVLLLIVALTKHFLPYRNNNDSWLSFRAALEKLNLNMRDKTESLIIHHFRSNV